MTKRLLPHTEQVKDRGKIQNRKGLFVVIEGIDGSGKGEIERALITYEQRLGRAVFDSIAFSKANRRGLPELNDFWNPPKTYYDTIVTAEPTYCGIGHVIRNEISANNDRKYSAETEIEAFSLDGLIQMKRVVIPVLDNGLTVIQSRNLASRLNYQSIRAEDEGKNKNETRVRILDHEGNKLELEYAPDLLIIARIEDVTTSMDRIASRKRNEKDDGVIYDTEEFQTRLNVLYQDPWLKDLFESRGTKVAYLDTNISPADTREKAAKIYADFLSSRK